jgi:hypothetical protein
MATILSPGLIFACLRNFKGITTWYFFETVTVSIVHHTVQRIDYRYKLCLKHQTIFQIISAFEQAIDIEHFDINSKSIPFNAAFFQPTLLPENHFCFPMASLYGYAKLCGCLTNEKNNCSRIKIVEPIEYVGPKDKVN